MGNARKTGTHLWKLALEDIDLVEKEDDGRPEEPSRVGDGLNRASDSCIRFYDGTFVNSLCPA